MAVDPSLMSVTPHEPERVIPDRLNVGQLDVATFYELDWSPVTLTLRAGAVPTK
jgi:hypothetical protein